MPLPSSGAISLNNVNQQLGKASPYNQTITMNDSDLRTLFQKTGSATQISMSDGYGKSSIVTFSGGNSYSWTVPSGITSIFVKAWGGGGGGGGPNGDGYGGAGGYFEGNISVSAGNTIDISVPGVATGDVDYQCACDENDEWPTNIPNNSGAGGGAAVVSYSTTSTYCIVGGGGGGANGDGGPGGSDGGNGYAAGDGGGVSPYGGGGGGSTSGGIGWCGGSVHSGTTPGSGCTNWNRGLAFQCATSNNSAFGGGGGRGGDGWAGGGTGYGQAATGLCDAYPGGAGGGGGSTGWTGSGWSNTVSIRNTDLSYSGSRRVAPETGNVDYPGSNVAYGANFGAFGGDGGPGYVVIRY